MKASGHSIRKVSAGTRHARAFTLVEVVVALGIAATVVVAMTTMLFSMGELWGRNSDRFLFDLHARNVTRFLQRELYSAAFPPGGGAAGAQSAAGGATTAASSAGSSTETPPVSIQEVRDQTGNISEFITYELANGSRLCAWPDRALPNVVCSLAFREKEGLILLWHSRLETNFDIDAPRETVITPFVTSVSYDYYDLDLNTWKNEQVLRKDSGNAGLLPQRLRLVFTHSGRAIETIIDIPGAPSQGLPML